LPDDVLADVQLGDNGKLLSIVLLHSISTTASAKVCGVDGVDRSKLIKTATNLRLRRRKSTATQPESFITI
jgi:hypothetical protein